MSSIPTPPSKSNTSTPQPQQTKQHPAHKLLSRAHSPDSTQSIFTEKIRNKPLLLHPTTNTTSTTGTITDSRALRRHIRQRKKAYHLAHQKPRPFSAKQKRELGLYDLHPDLGECKYETYEELNKLWRGYFLEVMNLGSNGRNQLNAQSHGSLLASLDYHGMALEVIRSRDQGRVGMKGIVVRETKYTFVLVCKGDKVKRIMKRGTVFRVVVDVSNTRRKEDSGENVKKRQSNTSGPEDDSQRTVMFELYGDQLEIRPIERAVKKFKWRSMEAV